MKIFFVREGVLGMLRVAFYLPRTSSVLERSKTLINKCLIPHMIEFKLR